jgi:hypothetical protein
MVNVRADSSANAGRGAGGANAVYSARAGRVGYGRPVAAGRRQLHFDGEIIKDQYDELYKEVKYVIYGDTLAGDEMAGVARWDDARSVVVITVYRLRITDYE